MTVGLTNMHEAGRSAVVLLIGLLIAATIPSIAFARSVNSLGKPGGYVNDYFNTLGSADKSNGTEMVIAIIDSTDGRTIEDYAQELFDKWEIGQKAANNGLLVLVAINDRKWRVQTGYGLEGVLPDTLAARIMQNEAVPAFRDDDYGEGLINAAEQFKAVLQGEKYSGGGTFNFGWFFIPPSVLAVLGVLIWLAVRVKCPRCGSRVRLLKDDEVLEATYQHSGIRKMDYACTVCHHEFSRMNAIPMKVEVSASGGGTTFWSSSSSGGFSGGGSSFGGFGGGSSGGGGASGGW
jgi:uncharacterized protein